MKKETIYSLRMNKSIKESLKKAAKKENRSVASLLDKIIKEYLEGKGFLNIMSDVSEQRWFTRKEIYTPAKITLEADSESKCIAVVILDISFGGVLIAYPKSNDIDISLEDLPQFELRFDLSDKEQLLCFQCEANRMIDSGYGVQVGANFVNTDQSDLQRLRNSLN